MPFVFFTPSVSPATASCSAPSLAISGIAATATGVAGAIASAAAIAIAGISASASGAANVSPSVAEIAVKGCPATAVGGSSSPGNAGGYSPAISVGAIAATAVGITDSSGLPDPSLTDCGFDLMANGMSWLTSQLQKNASYPVIYRRGSAAIAVCATIGQTMMKLNDGDGGIRMEWTDRDFLIPYASLAFSGNLTTPARGDTIKESRGGTISVYEVYSPGGEQPWRWSDPYHNMLRIHTKLISETPA